MISDLLKTLALTPIVVGVFVLGIGITVGVYLLFMRDDSTPITLNTDEWVCTNTTTIRKKILVGIVPNQHMITENVEVCVEYKHK